MPPLKQLHYTSVLCICHLVPHITAYNFITMLCPQFSAHLGFSTISSQRLTKLSWAMALLFPCPRGHLCICQISQCLWITCYYHWKHWQLQNICKTNYKLCTFTFRAIHLFSIVHLDNLLRNKKNAGKYYIEAWRYLCPNFSAQIIPDNWRAVTILLMRHNFRRYIITNQALSIFIWPQRRPFSPYSLSHFPTYLHYFLY